MQITGCAVRKSARQKCLSDLCCICPAGQGNYGYANSVCDMLCMSRRAAGKPALAIAWGPMDHVGYVAEILKVRTPIFMHLPAVS